MKISFDPSKDRINRREHDGVSLSEVEAIFYDAFALTVEDRDHAEDRFVTLGTDVLGRLLVVAYCYRGEDEIRVFSARHALPHERRVYEEGER